MVVHHVIEGARGDVRERQKGNAGVGGIEAEICGGEVLIRSEVAMGKRDAFGFAGGSRSVDERGQIAGRNGAKERIEDGVTLDAEGVGIAKQIAHGDSTVRSGRVHYYDELQLGLRAHGVKLVELLAGGDDGDAAIRVAHLFGDLLAGEGGIKRHIGGAYGQGGEIGDGPLPAILADDGDTVALLSAEAQKSGGQRADALIHLIR